MALVALLSLPTCATPVYYTFEGVVNYIDLPSGQPFVGGQIAVGDKVDYVFLVDRDLQGLEVHHDFLGILPRTYNSDSTNYFYDEFVGGTIQQAVYNSGEDVFYFGSETILSDGTYRDNIWGTEPEPVGQQFDNYAGNRVRIYGNTSVPMSDWQPGIGSFTGLNEVLIQVDSNSIAGLRISSDLQLTGISTTNPLVPEPSSLVSFAFGVGVLGFAFRFRKPRMRS